MDTETTLDDVKDAIEDIGEQFDEVERQLAETASSVTSHLRPARERVAVIRDRVRDAGESAAELSDELLDDVEDELDELRIELGRARSDLRAATAKHVDGYREALDEQLGNWKSRVESLALHADLARMEMRDEVLDLHERYVATKRAARRDVRHVEKAGAQTWESVRDRVRDELNILGVDYNRLLDKIKRQ